MTVHANGEVRAPPAGGSTEPGREKPDSTNKSTMWDLVNNDLVVALVLHLSGMLAVVVLFVVAALLRDGSAKELLATAVAAVTTLAAASGGTPLEEPTTALPQPETPTAAPRRNEPKLPLASTGAMPRAASSDRYRASSGRPDQGRR
jgi:hypothetical protein